MGIQGLLSFLKSTDQKASAIQQAHLTEFRNKRAAIDAYSWLHKGIFSCADDLFFNKPTTKYIDYCVKNIKLLQNHRITPILVFDGGRMPFKIVEEKRRNDRHNAKLAADDLVAMGKANEAYMQMVQSINVTHEMASNLIKAARKLGVESIVAPYEADAQLVYLENQGIVDFIISEDSDLIIFGAKKVFFKMAPTGHGELFNCERMEGCLRANKRLMQRIDFSFEKLQYAAILSGCDYLKNLPGVGIIKAYKFINMTDNSNIRQFIKKIPSYLKLPVEIDENYVDSFIKAFLAFKYQIVFDTRQKRRVTLNPLTTPEGDFPVVTKDDFDMYDSCFKANELDHLQLALGNIDNKNKNKEFDTYHPSITSYLYYGDHGVNLKAEPESPGNATGFKTDGVYKRMRKFSYTEPSQETGPNDSDLANFYKNLDISKLTPVKKQESPIEPPPKRIKCKFLKNKSKDDQFEPVVSRFFNKSSAEIETNSLSQKENVNDDENDLSMTMFKDAGVELDSDTDSGPLQIDESNAEEIVVDVEINQAVLNDCEATPVKEAIARAALQKLPDSPLSPVLAKKIEPVKVIPKIKPQLKEIQNTKKVSAKGKKQLMFTKNQPTLFGFFTKL